MFLPVTLELLTGFWETLKIFFLTLLFSIPLGLMVCFGRCTIAYFYSP